MEATMNSFRALIGCARIRGLRPSRPPRRSDLKLLWPTLAATLVLALHLSGGLAPAEHLVGDALLRALPPAPAAKVAAVVVDEAALRAGGPWPWDRDRLAQVVEDAFAAGARGVAVDLLLPEARPGDARLAQALARGPSVLAVGVADDGRWLWPDPALRQGELAHVSFDLDQDGVIRRFAATRQSGGQAFAAFPVAAARLSEPRLPVPVGRILRPGFRVRAIPTVGAADLLAGRPAPALVGRVVFIGTTAAGLGDQVVTPVSERGVPEPGVLVEAQATEAILSGDLLHPVPPLLEALLAFGLTWLGALLLAAGTRASRAFAGTLLLVPFGLAVASLRLLHLAWEPLTVLLALLAVGGLAAWARARRSLRDARAAGARISELEQIQATLAETGVRDAEARRVVAHELKTPLTSVRGLAQLLAQYDLSADERARVAGMVVSEASRLAQMVDALLDLERLRLRTFSETARPLDLSALCAERGAFLRAGMDRPFDAEVAGGVRVLGDPALLARVVENLVSNACKFSPEGMPVRLGLRAEGAVAVLEVEDRGPGIPAEERARIFGRFARGSTQGLAPGLGLGLALVAEVVAWHRGEVQADDGSDGGSCFRVRLPLIPAE
jgi:signal transduction histidine kinase